MNTSFFIAKRIAFQSISSFSSFIIRLSVAATAVSVAVMILTLSFVNGFQQTISQKMYSFWGNIRVQPYEMNKALVAEETPIAKNNAVLQLIKKQPYVSHVSSFASKSAVIENKKEIEGILLKGIENEDTTNAINDFIVKGSKLSFAVDSLYNKEIIVSEKMANVLKINIKDTITAYFIDNNGAANTFRKLQVIGFYKTGIEEYDKLFALVDIRLLQRINNWQQNEIGGYEIHLSAPSQSANISKILLSTLPSAWMSRTIQEIYPNIFEWLAIQNINRNVVFAIMGIIGIINLITCLLILVLERTKMVGVLKALGASNASIQQIFLFYASFIAISGVTIGLIIGVGIVWLQQLTHFITLDEAAYYVSYAPVSLSFTEAFLVAFAAIAVCFLALYIPTLLVKRMQPVKAIQFS